MIEILYLKIAAARHLLEPLIERLDIPVVTGHLRRDPFEHVRLYRIFDDLRNAFGEVLALKDRIAFVVDSFALQVHDIVVFEDVLTCREVHRFNLALGVSIAFETMELGWLIFGKMRFLHHVRDRIHLRSAEQAHEIIFEREVELRNARVPLTSRTTAQLVVDAAALVALGTDHTQTASGLDLELLLIGDSDRTIAGRFILFRSGSSPSSSSSTKNSCASTSGLPPSRMSVPRPAMFVAIVTAPLRPACATIEASRSWFFALSTSCLMPRLESKRLKRSELSIETVPTRQG